MMRKHVWIMVLICLAAMPALGQNEPERTKAGYKVDFTLSEMQDGKRINNRNYSLMVEEGGRAGSIRVGTRIPISSLNKEGQAATTYIDVGLNIDCKIFARGGRVAVDGTVEMNNFVADQPARPDTGAPVFRNNQARFMALVTLGKKTMVASTDDINSTRSTAVEITVTQL